ncbi:hypothetical protein PAXRUDRAFT_11213 [Paxillus rubicundulus Ve08.2h10]|uniref:Uncharacterized protein n=1 Tax=Paxillus rubicundulus Ve08.2h10 TaxID=930991 RepID=A0A0D0DEC5_9AGAM|nr:hypothetical protein PAXRUDRAFT_11213 [Paxillus rubicundulus Ve08.2h10]
MALNIPKAQLIGGFMESLFYGLYVMVFLQCMQVLRRRQSRPSDYLVGTAVSLFVLITAHVVVDIDRNMDAFTSQMGISNYPTTYYNIFDSWKNIVKSSLYVAITIISDAFIMYRCFIVWGRTYLVVAVPFLLLLADVGIGIFWIYTLSLVVNGENIFADALSVRLTTFYVITFVMNAMCTTLLAFRIWRIQRNVAPFARGNEDLSRIAAVIVESGESRRESSLPIDTNDQWMGPTLPGSAYSAYLIVMIATYTSNSPAMLIFLNSLSPIIGIVFSSVIVRVGLGLSAGDSHRANPSHPSGPRHPLTPRGIARPTASDQIYSTSNLAPYPDNGGGVQVSLQKTVHTHIDEFLIDGEGDSGGDYKNAAFHAV